MGVCGISPALSRISQRWLRLRILDPQSIQPEQVQEYLATEDAPPVDLLIRTSGEKRISNFLLWQCAYAEFYFCDTLWPDFTAKDLDAAIDDFQQRNRRFGRSE